MAEPYETNKVSLPPMTPFGVAYQQNLRTRQDQAAGVARAKQEGIDWDSPELIHVPNPYTPMRYATHAENADTASKVVGGLGAAAALFSNWAGPVGGAARVAMPVAAGYFNGWGADALDAMGMKTVDYDKIPKNNQKEQPDTKSAEYILENNYY